MTRDACKRLAPQMTGERGRPPNKMTLATIGKLRKLLCDDIITRGGTLVESHGEPPLSWDGYRMRTGAGYAIVAVFQKFGDIRITYEEPQRAIACGEAVDFRGVGFFVWGRQPAEKAFENWRYWMDRLEQRCPSKAIKQTSLLGVRSRARRR